MEEYIRSGQDAVGPEAAKLLDAADVCCCDGRLAVAPTLRVVDLSTLNRV